MPYSIIVKTSAAKELRRLPEAIRKRMKRAIAALADNPRPHGVTKLKGSVLYRVRVGEYRVVYEIDDAAMQVVIFRARGRDDVYRH